MAVTPGPLRIALWVCPVPALAGVARHITDVAAVGIPGHRLVVTAPEGPLLQRLRLLECPVVPLAVDGPVARVVGDLRHTVRSLQPAVVHSHLAKADFLAALATPGTKSALVSTEHHIPQDPIEFHGSRRRAAGRRAAHRLRVRRFDRFIAVSESTRRDMRRQWRPSAPITVILNGIGRSGSDSVPAAGLRVLSLTRLAPEKNLTATLNAFALVHADHPAARLTMAGEGPLAAELRATAAGLGVADAVDFPGFVDAEAALAAHDVVVQPSTAENCSYTLLDAMRHGLGVVASPIGGNPELLPVHCLVAASDHRALAASIVDQGLHPTRRPSLPDAVPTVEQMAARIADCYREVTGR